MGRLQQLAVTEARRVAAEGHWEAASQRKANQAKAAEGKRRQALWIEPDNGVYTTINVRGTADPQGGIQYNSNFVYGPPGTPMQQPDPVSDQWWRYTDTGYKAITGPSTGGYTPNYEMINVGPMESDGSEWGYVPSPSTPVYNYFPNELYPSSSVYNYPGALESPAIGNPKTIQKHRF